MTLLPIFDIGAAAWTLCLAGWMCFGGVRLTQLFYYFMRTVISRIANNSTIYDRNRRIAELENDVAALERKLRKEGKK